MTVGVKTTIVVVRLTVGSLLTVVAKVTVYSLLIVDVKVTAGCPTAVQRLSNGCSTTVGCLMIVVVNVTVWLSNECCREWDCWLFIDCWREDEC